MAKNNDSLGEKYLDILPDDEDDDEDNCNLPDLEDTEDEINNENPEEGDPIKTNSKTESLPTKEITTANSDSTVTKTIEKFNNATDGITPCIPEEELVIIHLRETTHGYIEKMERLAKKNENKRLIEQSGLIEKIEKLDVLDAAAKKEITDIILKLKDKGVPVAQIIDMLGLLKKLKRSNGFNPWMIIKKILKSGLNAVIAGGGGKMGETNNDPEINDEENPQSQT